MFRVRKRRLFSHFFAISTCSQPGDSFVPWLEDREPIEAIRLLVDGNFGLDTTSHSGANPFGAAAL